MPLHSNKDESEILDFIFRQNSTLDKRTQEENISTYFAIKYHLPSEIFKSGNLKFNYNKGLTYILASFKNIAIFKIPNTKKDLIEIICPPDKNFIKSLNISETQIENTLKKYKDSKAKYWYIKATSTEILSFSSSHWETFTNTLKDLTKK